MKKTGQILLILAAVVPLLLFFASGRSLRLQVSHSSGFYEGPFYLTITAPTGRIYYTLDGSDPTMDSIPYTGPIYIEDASNQENVLSARTDLDSFGQNHPEMIDTQIPEEKVDKCTILKAAYFDFEGNRKGLVCESYFVGFGEKTGYGNFKVVSIVTEPQNLTDYDTGIFVRGRTYDELKEGWGDQAPGNYSQKGREWERPATFQYIDADGTLLYESNCGIRTMGGWQRKAVIKSLNLVARREYGGTNTFQYDFWGTGYLPHKMTLHSGSNDFYGKIQNMLVSNLTRGLDYGTMHYEVCLVFLNGEYWGIYNLTEKYDERYLENTYHVSKENVFSVKAGEPENGDSKYMYLYTDAEELLEALDMTQDENYEKFRGLFDEQSLLDLFGVELYCGRTFDWPNGNIHLWRTVTSGGGGYSDGRWRYLLYDMDSIGLTENYIEEDNIQWAMDHCGYFRSLCRNETFRKKLGANILRIGEEYLSPERVNAAIDTYQAALEEPMKTYFKRFFNSDASRFYEHLESNRSFFNNRMEAMKKILEAHDRLP